MNCAAMILDPVGVANLDEVNLSYMVESGVIFPDFTWLIRLSFVGAAYGYYTLGIHFHAGISNVLCISTANKIASKSGL